MDDSTLINRRWDVVVVGGRVAGATLALLLARRGARVVVLERARRGADTLSTHALMRAGVHQLARLGVLDDVVAAGAPMIRRTRFVYPDESVTIPIRPHARFGGLYAPRRTVLDPILADAAASAGAEVRFGTTVVDVELVGGGRVGGVVARDGRGELWRHVAPVVVGADGLRSAVARRVDAPVERTARAATANAYAYFEGIAAEGYDWGFAPGAAAGLIPTDHGQTLAFAGVPDRRFGATFGADAEAGFWSVLGELGPVFTEALRGRRRVSRFHSFAGRPGQIRRPYGPGWLLVGDAGYYKDPISAHGMTDALVHAELAADAVADMLEGAEEHRVGRDFARRRDELALDLFDATEAIARHDADISRTKAALWALSEAMRAENAELERRDVAQLRTAV